MRVERRLESSMVFIQCYIIPKSITFNFSHGTKLKIKKTKNKQTNKQQNETKLNNVFNKMQKSSMVGLGVGWKCSREHTLPAIPL